MFKWLQSRRYDPENTLSYDEFRDVVIRYGLLNIHPRYGDDRVYKEYRRHGFREIYHLIFRGRIHHEFKLELRAAEEHKNKIRLLQEALDI